MTLRMTLLLPLLASACGDATPDPITITLTPPSVGEAATCAGTTFTGSARATLHISGNIPPCILSFENDGRVVGVCPQIPTGVVRSLVLTYGLVDTTSPSEVVPLVYAYRFLDLRAEALEGAPAVLTVEFVDPAVSGVVKSAADIAALPATPASNDPLDAARSFARGIIASDNLDFDDDGCANVVEACNNHLFDGTPGC